ncbi:Zinc finger CCCH domaincontaining protein 6like [Caligus rogercresseyi]|uniref:Zinc finger CCCH domaincontaining protein 6like n=1 Tax=Caligus rogercresseyi TaxID=217165 RepID=A0A7T8KKL7_CALRO|nr:Zinc finger CCCH domaincontaining protein 6like [Caligus rogercresseyi]
MDRVCQFYLRGRCNRSNCEFKHVKPSEGGSGSSSIYRKTPCRFFEANGSCRFGDNCRFFHDAASNLRETRSKVSKAIVDSDEDLPLGIESEDEESNVSGFTDCNTIVGKRARKTPGGSDALKEAKSADSSASGTPLARKSSGGNDESLISDSMPKTPSGTPHLKVPSPKNLVVARKSLPKAIEELSNISEEEEEEERIKRMQDLRMIRKRLIPRRELKRRQRRRKRPQSR